MRSSIILILLAFAIDASANYDLFHIKRNKNRNEFHYEGMVTDCQWQDSAVHGQWHELEEGPDVREGIAPWEGRAYGHKTRRLSPTSVEVVLNAKKDLPVQVELSNKVGGCDATATTLINGEQAQLRFVYVCARERFLMWPKVQYVDVHGFDDTGRPVVQRFPRTKWAKQLGAAAPLDANEDPPMNAPRCGHPENQRSERKL